MSSRAQRRARGWSITWHGWLTTVLVSFAALEAYGLATDGEDATLTAHLRRTLGVHPRRPYCLAGQTLLVSVLGWLTVHLVAGRWPADGWTAKSSSR